MQKGARKKSKHFDFKAIYIIPTIRSVKESHLVGGSKYEPFADFTADWRIALRP